MIIEKKKDGRASNGGARKGSGRKPSPEQLRRKNTTVQVDPVVVFKARSRHGSLAKALAYAADHG